MRCDDKQPTNASSETTDELFCMFEANFDTTTPQLLTQSAHRRSPCRRDTPDYFQQSLCVSNRVVPAPRPNPGAPPEQHPRNRQHGHGDEAEQARRPVDPQPVVHCHRVISITPSRPLVTTEHSLCIVNSGNAAATVYRAMPFAAIALAPVSAPYACTMYCDVPIYIASNRAPRSASSICLHAVVVAAIL